MTCSKTNEKWGNVGQCVAFFWKYTLFMSRQFLLNVSTEKHIKENDDEMFKFLKKIF